MSSVDYYNSLGVDPAIIAAILARQRAQGTVSPPNTGGISPPIAPPPPTAPAPAPTDPAAAARAAYLQDPSYLLSVMSGNKAKTGAASSYLEALKPLLLQYGSQSMAQDVLGKLTPELSQYLGYTPDTSAYLASFAGADNPDTGFSTLAQLARAERENQLNTTENYNKHNLYYSGHFAKALGDLAYQSQLARTNAANDLQNKITPLGQNYLNQLLGVDTNLSQAARDAYGTALQAALQQQQLDAQKQPPNDGSEGGPMAGGTYPNGQQPGSVIPGGSSMLPEEQARLNPMYTGPTAPATFSYPAPKPTAAPAPTFASIPGAGMTAAEKARLAPMTTTSTASAAKKPDAAPVSSTRYYTYQNPTIAAQKGGSAANAAPAGANVKFVAGKGWMVV